MAHVQRAKLSHSHEAEWLPPRCLLREAPEHARISSAGVGPGQNRAGASDLMIRTVVGQRSGMWCCRCVRRGVI